MLQELFCLSTIFIQLKSYLNVHIYSYPSYFNFNSD